jgi:hypothetical protein
MFISGDPCCGEVYQSASCGFNEGGCYKANSLSSAIVAGGEEVVSYSGRVTSFGMQRKDDLTEEELPRQNEEKIFLRQSLKKRDGPTASLF